MYRLQDVCQLVTDLQNCVNEQHESAVDRQTPCSPKRHLVLSRV